MDVFISHIWYIAATFALGMIAGWKSYPAYRRWQERRRQVSAESRRT